MLVAKQKNYVNKINWQNYLQKNLYDKAWATNHCKSKAV
jgi:hypothetical protein